MVRLIAILIIYGAPNFGVLAQPEVRCDIRANLLDEDSNGTNVRGGAGRAFPVTGVLPHGRTDVGTVVGKGAWVKISGAEGEDGGTVFDSPDGEWVIVQFGKTLEESVLSLVVTQKTIPELWLMRLDGTGLRLLVKNGQAPSWGLPQSN